MFSVKIVQKMLIQFSLKNFRSVRERQTLSLAASTSPVDSGGNNTFDSGLGEKAPRLVRSAAIYGTNAAGKSTIINALAFVEELVINSAKERQANEKLDLTPFRLSALSRNADSEFEVTFVEEGVRYQFGFCANTDQVTEEWLYAFPNGHQQKWYHRAFDKQSENDVYKFSKFFEGGRRKSDWQQQTRKNALFLSTAILLNNKQLKPAFNWFSERLRIVRPHQLLNSYTIKKCQDPVVKNKILAFLNAADLFIADIKVETRAFAAEEIHASMPQALREEIIKTMSGKKISEAKFLHKDIDSDELIEFEETDESDGTQQLFSFAGPWLDVLENDRVLVVDEIDASLHPLIVHHLVNLLHRENGRAQLVFTTHDASLLSKRLLRKDQIWFVEKSAAQETHLYPLTDFGVREQEAIEKGYLSGRYGAVPLLREFKSDGN